MKNQYEIDYQQGYDTANEEWLDRMDKIRAEIEQLRLHKAEFLTNDNKVCIDSQAVLNIIDKYKVERSEKE